MKTDLRRRTLIRQQRVRSRLGSQHPICVLCSFAHLAALRGMRWGELPPHLRARLVELHHPLGRCSHPEAVVPLCLNCHAMITELERQVGALDRGGEDELSEGLIRAAAWLYAFVCAARATASAVLHLLEQIPARLPESLSPASTALVAALRGWLEGEPDADSRIAQAQCELLELLELHHPRQHELLTELLATLNRDRHP
jgi:hypothetical protein